MQGIHPESSGQCTGFINISGFLPKGRKSPPQVSLKIDLPRRTSPEAFITMSGAVIQRTFGSSVQLLVRAQKPSLAQLLLATGAPLGVLRSSRRGFVLEILLWGSSDGGRLAG